MTHPAGGHVHLRPPQGEKTGTVEGPERRRGLSGRNLSRRSPHHALRDAGREHFLRPRSGSTCPCLRPKISSRRTLTNRCHDAGVRRRWSRKAGNGEIMMRAMRAESFTGYEGLKLVEMPRPRRADGRVLVRITAAGVTPLDHTILSGKFPHQLKAPLVLGNEGAGVVEEGGGTDFPVGSRVMFFGPYGAFEDGTYSEWVAA